MYVSEWSKLKRTAKSLNGRIMHKRDLISSSYCNQSGKQSDLLNWIAELIFYLIWMYALILQNCPVKTDCLSVNVRVNLKQFYRIQIINSNPHWMQKTKTRRTQEKYCLS